MGKVFLLGANKEIDTNKQTVEVNQVIRMEGYSYDRYVVYEIYTNEWGINYKLINLRTKDFRTADMVRPLSEKFGIGYYYDAENPEFMDAFEVLILRQEAEQQKQAQDEAEKQERQRVEEVKKIGRERFVSLLPEDAQAVIVARLKQDESDSQSDYFASSTQRTVILGFSKHKRDIFSEMRKHASNFEGTAYLAEFNEDYEHREKYSMGAGYYLGESNYHGWIIEKVGIYKRENTIEEFAYTAGSEENIHIKSPAKTASKPDEQPQEPITGDFIIVDYSEKSIAVFGDTKPIKDQLSDMGGCFNRRLKHNGEITPGWIFQKRKEQEVREFLNLNK